jgi:hypothetical protein
VNADLPAAVAQAAVRAVRVQTVFHVADDRQAQVVAAKMVDSAHEIANLPECECDVDVTIERTVTDAGTDPAESGVVPPKQP